MEINTRVCRGEKGMVGLVVVRLSHIRLGRVGVLSGEKSPG